ncbi:hypothetical protein CVU75_01690 [Candidatus Dependentiae bacterium HGW-Dependentiae-1]|nr:MAG: hypothetical protein CVU75_01690 [Candidatus Dependentiae bacterium HGW-Dependentiae-1]
MIKRLGIVIASLQPRQNKIVVLDQEQGKFICVPDRKTVNHGMLLTYFVRRDNKTEFLYATELLATPVTFAIHDLLFFHHVMEICFHFLPLACQTPAVFDLLSYFYKPEMAHLDVRQQKLFLCKFFALLGIYPEEFSQDPVRISQIAFYPIDRMLAHNVDLNFKETELDSWLLSCVLSHPYSAHFKTVHFLTQGRGV